MSHSLIQIETQGEHGEIAVVRLHRPSKRNALNDALILAVRNAFAGLPKSVRAAVLCGAGEHFCAGLDKRRMQALQALI